jgi:molecular chaperone GrpE
MTDDSRRVPIKVKVVDKRKNKPQAEAEEGSASPVGEADPRVDAGVGSSAGEPPLEVAASAGAAQVGAEEEVAEAGRDYLDDLRRVQAEFDNFRKRTFKERQQLEARGKKRVVEQLLPVLDNFERAIAHGEGGAGVELVFRELRSLLEGEGLAEIPAEGESFDPQVHEAVESVEDTDVDEPTITQVYRRGYSFGGDVVRPAMVVVARPAETRDVTASDEEDQAEVAGGA